MPGTVERDNRGGLGLDGKSMMPSSSKRSPHAPPQSTCVCRAPPSVDPNVISLAPPQSMCGCCVASSSHRGWKTPATGNRSGETDSWKAASATTPAGLDSPSQQPRGVRTQREWVPLGSGQKVNWTHSGRGSSGQGQ